MPKVFDNQTIDGDSLFFPGVNLETYDASETFNGGKAQIAIDGDFDGAVIEVHVDSDGSGASTLGFIKLVGQDQIEPDVNNIDLARGNRVKLVLTGAGGSTDISATIINL